MNGADIREVLATEARLLFFRSARPDLQRHRNLYLALGIGASWLVGVGRYWDNPKAETWQMLGLGSVAYIFLLALLLYAVLAPLRPNNWTYQNILIFVGMTAPPGLIYAIPVERWYSLETAQSINVTFLAVVAAWRVALLVLYLKRSAGLSPFAVLVASLVPLALIVVTLTMLNLEHVVFNVMGGIAQHQRGPNDVAYEVMVTISLFSFLASPFLLITYTGLVWARWKKAVERTIEPEKDVQGNHRDVA